MIKKYSVTIHGHRTSLSLEREYWLELKNCAKHQKKSLATLISELDNQRMENDNLSSTIRVYILNSLKGEIELLTKNAL